MSTCTSHSTEGGIEKPRYELSDIFDLYADDYVSTHRLSWHQRQVIWNILNCRTSSLGYHVRQCDRCSYTEQSYNSCRDRHCPKCQYCLQDKWVGSRMQELLPIPYFHVVFTLPGELNDLMLLNKKVVYRLFFESSSEVLKDFGRNNLACQVGFIGILHSWSQTLSYHVHLHYILSGGGLSLEGKGWVGCKYNPKFIFAVKALSKVMRGKFIEKLKKSYHKGELIFEGEIQDMSDEVYFEYFLETLSRKAFVVYTKRPFSTPKKVLEYMSRYVHRVAISNWRLVDIRCAKITFTYRDRGGQSQQMSLDAGEFIRRFLLHILPKGFKKVRHYGFLSPSLRQEKIPLARHLLGCVAKSKEVVEEVLSRFGLCKVCRKGRMLLKEIVYALEGYRSVEFDTS